MDDQVMIQIKFKRVYEKENQSSIEYNDAIYLTETEYENIKAEDLEALKDERFNAWKSAVDNPPVPVEMTEDELIAYKEELLKLSLDVQGKIDETEVKIVEKEAEKIEAEKIEAEKIEAEKIGK